MPHILWWASTYFPANWLNLLQSSVWAQKFEFKLNSAHLMYVFSPNYGLNRCTVNQAQPLHFLFDSQWLSTVHPPLSSPSLFDSLWPLAAARRRRINWATVAWKTRARTRIPRRPNSRALWYRLYHHLRFLIKFIMCSYFQNNSFALSFWLRS